MSLKRKIVQGRVVESLPDLTYRVELEDGKTILAYLSGKMRINFIKVIPGDYVMVELSPYDETRGRIIKRL